MKEAIARLGSGPLTENGLREHIWPLFSRVLARPGIYLANHSLGRPLDSVAGEIGAGVDQWYERLDEAWEDDGWPAEIDRFREGVARLIGAPSGDCVVPKTSAGQGLRAVLNALPVDRPLRIVATRGEFDSIDFILKTYAHKGRAEVRWVEGQGDIPLFRTEDVLNAITSDVDLVVVSQVFFSTGQVMPGLKSIVEKAHELGSLVLVDAYHSAGVFPVDMAGLGADFMIGGSYKYTRGGPGACWLAIHPRHLDGSLRTLDTGWFAKESPFSYARPEPPRWAMGGSGWMESTPPVLTAYQALPGLEFTLEIGVDRLRAYNLEQQGLLRAEFRAAGVGCYDPVNSEEFGAFALVPHQDAAGASKRLAERGVITDARGGCIRFGPDILNSQVELEQAARISAEVL